MKTLLKTLAIVALSIAMLAPAKSEEPMPVPSIPGMFCSSPCENISYAPDRRLGEIATLLVYRAQCLRPMVSDAQIFVVQQEWNAAPQEARNEALKHEAAAVDARIKKYGQGMDEWFCPTMTRHFVRGDYQQLLSSSAERMYQGKCGRTVNGLERQCPENSPK
jgi:hypothetical protein